MLCVYSVLVAICNTRNSLTTKRHAPVPTRSVASRLAALACYAVARRSLGLRVFACYALTGAIVCRPTLRRFAPSLRAQFSFLRYPGVPWLPSPLLRSSAEAGRRSTAGLYFIAPLRGSKIRLTAFPSSRLLALRRGRRMQHPAKLKFFNRNVEQIFAKNVK